MRRFGLGVLLELVGLLGRRYHGSGSLEMGDCGKWIR